MPAVSVIIPSYNHARYIGQAIQSVLDQSLRDLELIVIDDGSRDDSLKVIERFHDPRMIVKSQSNMGAHAAINAGIERAQSNVLAILNSDDRYHPQRLEKLIELLHNTPQAGLAASYLEVIDANGRVAGVKHGYRNMPPWEIADPSRSFRAGDNLKHALLAENYLSTTSNYVFTREAWQRHGPFRPLRYVHDWDFSLRVIRDMEVALLPEALMQYRIHASNTIRENQAAMIFELCWCMALHMPALAGATLQQDAGFVLQFLHSLHEHGCSPVLATLLTQWTGLPVDARESHASMLLDPNNPHRRAYIEYIEACLSAKPIAGNHMSGGWRARIRALANTLKAP